MRLVAVDHHASRCGLAPGQNLSDARALVPDLQLREADHAYLGQVFSDFADWHSNASPIVAIHDAMAPYGDLALDITGVDHLFGGEAKMLQTLTGRLSRLGFTVSGAIASSIGAAWAFAHFTPGAIVAAEDMVDHLAPLPVSALRLEQRQLAGLDQLGLKQVGQLYGRDRKALQARFGTLLLTRLDQALGHMEERVTPRLPVAEYYAERRFAEPIGYMDDVLMTTRDLAIQIAMKLEAAERGAQTFHLLLYRVDHKVMTLSVNAARATRDAEHIARLFAHRSERLGSEYDAGFGIDMIRLGASSVDALSSAQIGVFETRDGTEDLDRLYDRMTSRLGPLAVVRTKFVNTHIPEHAVKLEPVIARTADDPHARPDPDLPRPLRLLPRPEPVEVIAEVPHGPPMRMIWRRIAHRVARATGPERIEAEWWRSGQDLDFLGPRGYVAETEEMPDGQPAAATGFRSELTLRDYYVIEDEAGRRFWVFRIGLYGASAAPRWYLHGVFP